MKLIGKINLGNTYFGESISHSCTYLFWPCSESPLLNLLEGQMKFLRSRSLCWFQWLHHPVWERWLVLFKIYTLVIYHVQLQECKLNMLFSCIQDTYNIIMYVCVLTSRDKLWWLKQNTMVQCVHNWISNKILNDSFISKQRSWSTFLCISNEFPCNIYRQCISIAI